MFTKFKRYIGSFSLLDKTYWVIVYALMIWLLLVSWEIDSSVSFISDFIASIPDLIGLILIWTVFFMIPFAVKNKIIKQIKKKRIAKDQQVDHSEKDSNKDENQAEASKEKPVNKVTSKVKGKAKVKKDKEIYSVGIPNADSSNKIVFSETDVWYDGTSIDYADIIGYSFQSVASSLNGIPTNWTANVQIESDTDRIRPTFDAPLRMGRADKEAVYQELVRVCSVLFDEMILDKLVSEIADGNQIEIASIKISQEGLSRPKVFGKELLMPWDKYHSSNYNAGLCNIFQTTENGKSKLYSSASMDALNVPVLQVLLGRLANKYS